MRMAGFEPLSFSCGLHQLLLHTTLPGDGGWLEYSVCRRERQQKHTDRHNWIIICLYSGVVVVINSRALLMMILLVFFCYHPSHAALLEQDIFRGMSASVGEIEGSWRVHHRRRKQHRPHSTPARTSMGGSPAPLSTWPGSLAPAQTKVSKKRCVPRLYASIIW